MWWEFFDRCGFTAVDAGSTPGSLAMWWEFFDRCGFTEEEHVEHRATLGALTHAGEVAQVKRSVIHRYRFPKQAHEIAVGDAPKNPATAESDEFKKGFCGTVVALDETARTIDLKRGRTSPVPHPAALVPLDAVNSKVLHESLLRLAQEVASSGFAADSPRRAAFDLLRRVPPRSAAVAPPGAAEPRPNGPDLVDREDLVAREETPLEAVRRIAPRLDRSVLPVQGPPGSGKTYTGARMILDLLGRGRRVGVTANSHKVISNLLGAVCEAADRRRNEEGQTHGQPGDMPAARTPVDVHGIQKSKDGDGCPDARIVQTDSNEAVAEALSNGEANLAGGTAWLWAREEMAGAVDVLVIDEAGQMSLANTLAVCQAARSIVLLGDPRQLDQPIQGVHPPGADVSALGHLLGGSATVDPSRGVFLEHTWRMHPDLCAFTTEQFYEGRLGTRPELARQTVIGRGPLAGQGLRFNPLEHAGNTNASEEEAERVTALIRQLLGARAAWIDSHGVENPLTLQDILVVAPYNAHVATLRARLPAGARVGTVDKFQGQEAPIVLYSMATSTVDEAPRGMEFLYSLHGRIPDFPPLGEVEPVVGHGEGGTGLGSLPIGALQDHLDTPSRDRRPARRPPHAGLPHPGARCVWPTQRSPVRFLELCGGAGHLRPVHAEAPRMRRAVAMRQLAGRSAGAAPLRRRDHRLSLPRPPANTFPDVA